MNLDESPIRVRYTEPTYRNGFVWELAGWRHECLDGESVASHLIVTDHEMRVGGATVRMGGIQAVWTIESHRHRGLARKTIAHSNAWMVENGFDVALLFGINDFYHRFGYAVCLPDCHLELRTRDAELPPGDLIVRPYAEDTDLEAIRPIYAAENACRTGTFVRGSGEPWFRKGYWYGDIPERFVFVTPAGQLRAYAVRDASDEHVRIVEVGARSPTNYHAILAWAAERAVTLRKETIAFYCPPDHPLVEMALARGAKQTLTFPRNGAGMGRLVNLRAFFTKTRGEWERRAIGLPESSLRLETDIGAITLHWSGTEMALTDGAATTTVALPQSRLMQLAMGYHSAAFALTQPDLTLSPSPDLTLFRRLFPRRPGYLWRTDHF